MRVPPTLPSVTLRARARAPWKRLIFDTIASAIMSAQQHDPDAPCTPELEGEGEAGSARRRRRRRRLLFQGMFTALLPKEELEEGGCRKQQETSFSFFFFFGSNLDYFFFFPGKLWGPATESSTSGGGVARARRSRKRASAPRICCAQIETSCFSLSLNISSCTFCLSRHASIGIYKRSDRSSESLQREQASAEQTRGVALLSACCEMLLCCDIPPVWDVYSSVVSFRGNGDMWLLHLSLSRVLLRRRKTLLHSVSESVYSRLTGPRGRNMYQNTQVMSWSSIAQSQVPLGQREFSRNFTHEWTTHCTQSPCFFGRGSGYTGLLH